MRLFEFDFPSDIQIILIELTLKSQTWILIQCIYDKSSRQKSQYFLDTLSKAILFYSKYDNIIRNGENSELVSFLELTMHNHHMKDKNCWKHPVAVLFKYYWNNRNSANGSF